MRGLSLVVAGGGHSSSRCAGLSLSRPLLLRSTGSRRAGSVVVAHGPSCSVACGIFPDQGSNPCPLHWQADSQPLHHQGSPALGFTNFFILFLISILFISSLIFIISFLLLTFGFVCSSFSNAFMWRLGCLFEIFLFFEEGMYHSELPSKNCFCCIPYFWYGCVFFFFKIYLFLFFKFIFGCIRSLLLCMGFL